MEEYSVPRSALSLMNQNRHTVSETDYQKVAAWFLGPKGENKDLLLDMVKKSLEEHAEYRENHYKKGDPVYITDEIKDSNPYKEQKKLMEEIRKEVSDRLCNGCVPFFTPRYQAHMLWDTVLPGNIGYITAMLFNQNNVATEASPETSLMEKEAGKDLCHLLGFYEKEAGKECAWGHITADGSIANLESMWAARNLKYYPLSIREVLNSCPELKAARDSLAVPLSKGAEPKLFCNYSIWELLNMSQDIILSLSTEILRICEDVTPEAFDQLLHPHLLQTIGCWEHERHYPDLKPAKIMVPATNHYSWPKSAMLLGLGQDAVIGIPVDENCRMDMAALEEKLAECAKEKIPVFMTVAVIGTTEEGAVDNLESILALRDKFQKGTEKKGTLLNFSIHCDAAWGGYLKSMLIPNQKLMKMKVEESGFVPFLPMSEYAAKQYDCIAQTDTVTIDPHKAGFIPYPAGALCYRNGNLRSLITVNASYIHSDDELNMGTYGVEGSKAGAAAAAVWTAHRAIPLDQTGYGLILSECSFSTKLYYCYWLTLAEETDNFDLQMLVPLPETIKNSNNEIILEGEQEIRKFIKNRIIGKSNEVLSKDEEAMCVLQQVGTDVLINSFFVNFRTKDEKGNWVINTDVNLLNRLNHAVFEKFSILTSSQAKSDTVEYILMLSDLDTDTYAKPLAHVGAAWGIENFKESASVGCLINTIMNPWPTTHGFLDTIMKAFREGVKECIKEIEN